MKFDSKLLFCAVLGLAIMFFAPVLTAAEEKEKEKKEYTGDPAKLTVDRIFDVKDFDSKGFGPFRGLDDGWGYTTL
jgi:hypothetical protein